MISILTDFRLPKKPRDDIVIRQLKSILYANRGACKDKMGELQPAIGIIY